MAEGVPDLRDVPVEHVRLLADWLQAKAQYDFYDLCLNPEDHQIQPCPDPICATADDGLYLAARMLREEAARSA